MFLKNRTAIAALIVGIALSPVALAPVAMAQNAPNASEDRVLSLQGDVGQVLVLRGNKVFSLVQGDTLFAGDRVFTRTQGTAKVRFNGCERDVSAASSIVIDTTFCQAPLVTLAQTDVVGGVTIGAPAAGGIGATPALLGLAALGGGAAAAAGGGSSASP